MLTKLGEEAFDSLLSSDDCIFLEFPGKFSSGGTWDGHYLFHFTSLARAKRFAVKLAQLISNGVGVHPWRCNLGRSTFVVALRVHGKEYPNFTRDFWVDSPNVPFNKLKEACGR